MNLKGTKTEANLQTAFAGESQARNKYTFYASKGSEDLLFKITFKIFFLFSCFLCIAIFLPIW